MKIRDYRNFFISELSSVNDTMEAENFFWRILEQMKNLKRIDLALKPDLEFSDGEVKQLQNILGQLKKEIPIQYILGKTHFYGLEFYVDENVLIPRPETEELVNWIIKDNELKPNLKILDIGTGSGCIAISLSKNLPDSLVSAIDVSEKALYVAKKNAAENSVNVNFLLQDILETENLPNQFNIIASNPPYVRELEKHEIKKNVLNYEPHMALFVEDNDALIFYRKIADLAIENLPENGFLYFEINQYLGKQMLELLRNKGFRNIILQKDIYGNDRMIRAKK